MPTKRTLATTRIPARLTAFLSFSIAFGLFICPGLFAQQSGEHAPPVVDGYPVLSIGSTAPDFSLPGVDGKTHSLKDYAGSKVLVIIFTCDHCPVAQMYEKRINQAIRALRAAFEVCEYPVKQSLQRESKQLAHLDGSPCFPYFQKGRRRLES